MKPNQITSLDAAITLLLYTDRQRRRASEFDRWVEDVRK
jgi:hypothetical protein